MNFTNPLCLSWQTAQYRAFLENEKRRNHQGPKTGSGIFAEVDYKFRRSYTELVPFPKGLGFAGLGSDETALAFTFPRGSEPNNKPVPNPGDPDYDLYLRQTVPYDYGHILNLDADQ